MRIALIGVGQAGGKITEEFVRYHERVNGSFVEDALAINTAEADLHGLDLLPEEKRILIGQAEVNGHGVGADNELGATVAEQDIDPVMNALDEVSTHRVDAFLVVAALGGGTGSGGAPVIAKHLQRLYDEPVYGLGILPGTEEGSIYTLNAARSFQTFVREVDNLLVFDNDSWRQSGESMNEAYADINEGIARRFGVLFDAGEVGDSENVGESVVDASEIINTLDTGGVSTLGYATDEIRQEEKSGLLSRFTGGDSGPDEAEITSRVTGIIRKATLGQLTLPCEIDSAERALVIVSGPPNYLNRRGIEHSRSWLEEETGSMEVRGGDYPLPDAQQVAGVVLLSGVTDIPRVKELQRVAVEAQDRQQELASSRDEDLDDLVDDDNDDIDPLF